MKRAILILLACAAMTSCASFQPIERPAFDPAEYAQLEGRTGTGIVTGQVFLRTRIGEVRYGAGSEVMLNPVTSYSRFWYETGYQGSRNLAPPDIRQDKYIITTQADGNGNFRFENVPPGDYYLTSDVIWQVPIGNYMSSQQGGYISEPITVENGKEVKKMLTR